MVEVPAEDRAHYSKHSIDTEFDFAIGQKELGGCAYRTDYDLKAHSAASGKNLNYIPNFEIRSFLQCHILQKDLRFM